MTEHTLRERTRRMRANWAAFIRSHEARTGELSPGESDYVRGIYAAAFAAGFNAGAEVATDEARLLHEMEAAS